MVLGLKWFRARLSMEKEASKIPAMTGLYRKVSYSESTIQKYAEVSTAPPSVASDSTASDNNETVEYDSKFKSSSKADLTSQSSSSITDLEETPVKNNNKKPQINNYAIENVEPSTSTKDLNIKEQSTRDEESHKIIKNQSESDTKSPICSDNELVI